jgi:PTS hybrid protein
VIGIVVVSHSPRLAEAAVELALEMVGGAPPPIAIAAGAGEGVIGTDATKVAAAIDQVDSPAGVLVFMDLGSAVLSATMALEFIAHRPGVRLSDAPFVEGIIAAVVLAAAGAGIDEVEHEARSALESKRSQLGLEATAPSGTTEAANGSEAAEVALVNPDGLHSRPAAAIVKAVAEFDADVSIANLTNGKGPVAARSLMGIMSLGAKQGDSVRFTASGPDAARAVAELLAMATAGFGEPG